MSKKGSCELCTKPARMFCESDQASLCWDCDEKVHSANFLVAKHSRTLLCHACFCPTPWKADGLKLGPTVSVCHSCSLNGPVERGYEEVSQESESDDGEYESDIDTETTDYSDDDGENQVVPWTETAADAVVKSTGGSVVSSTEEEEASLKRMRDNPFEYEDEDGCSSSQNSDHKLCDEASARITSFQSDNNTGTASPSRLLRPLKMRRTSDNSDGSLVLTERSSQLNGTAAIVDKLRRLQQEMVTENGEASTVILGIRKLDRDMLDMVEF